MIDDASARRTVFHDFYTAAEKQADPSRQHTGLFFFHGKPGAPFAVIAPGVGFAYVASLHEGFPYAVEISSRGYNAFVLKYRARQGGRIATEDLAAALSYIVRNAGTLDVATRDYSLWGSSAGGRMAAAIGSHGTAPFSGSALPKPSALVLLYTGHSDGTHIRLSSAHLAALAVSRFWLLSSPFVFSRPVSDFPSAITLGMALDTRNFQAFLGGNPRTPLGSASPGARPVDKL
jgi:acetyl esterase/lipase